MRVLLVGVQDHGVAVLPEFLAGELPRGGQNLVRWRRRRHGQHDVVNEFRRPARRAVFLPPVLTGRELQVPIIEELLLLSRRPMRSPSSVSISRVPWRLMYAK